MLTYKEKYIFLLQNKKLISLKALQDAFFIKTYDIVVIAKFLKNYNNLMVTATAVDQPNKINRFFLHYLFSDYSLALRIYISNNINLIAQSLVSIYSSSIWLEREIFDLFGIYFKGDLQKRPTEDLRRILTDYHFKGHPLRKDFTLIGYTEKIYSQHTKTIKDKSNLFF